MKSETKGRGLGVVAAFVAVLIWSAVYSLKGELLIHLGPSELSFFQCLASMPMLALLAKGQKKSLKVPLHTVVRIMVSGVIGIAGFQAMVNYGIASVGSVVSAIFTGLLPPLCLLIDMLVLNHKPTRRQLIGIAASTVGILMVVGAPSGTEFNLVGYLVLFGSDLAWVAFCNFNQRVQKEEGITGPVLLFYQSLGALIVLGPISAFTMRGHYAAILEPSVLLGVVFLTLVNSVIAYLLLNFTLSRLNVVYCNIIFNLVPVVTMGLDFILYGNVAAPLQMIGTVLIVLSVLFS